MHRVLVQARMSSSRFPGKVLAPFLGKPLIGNVLERIAAAVSRDTIMLATSADPSDDPLALYVERQLGIAVYRGDLENVAARFQSCLREFPCEWFVRISGDSPVLDGGLLSHMLTLVRSDLDMVTNVATRTFPPGQSVEILRTAPFLAIDVKAMSVEDRVHVTLPYYRSGSSYRVLKVVSTRPELGKQRMVVDSVEDLRAVESLLRSEPERGAGYARLARTEQ